MKHYLALRAHVDGDYRQETLLGRDYIVVPVVALVEGVLQGMSAAQPELALASEYGRFPAGWDGRPVVMSHPVDKKGNPVSANSPTVLEDYAIGTLFNTHVDADGKLHTEAWVEVTRAEGLNTNSKSILATLQKGEMIEVSTGYFAELEETEGKHNGEKYFAIQRNIVPDHLAFLPEGTLGACSNADGCGAPRINKAIFSVNADSLKTAKDCGCGCNGEGTCKDSSMPQTNGMDEEGKGKNKGKKKQDPKAYEQGGEGAVALDLLANSIAGGITLDDARKLVSSSLCKSQMYSYVMAMTKDTVVYEQYNSINGAYNTYQRSYSVGADGKVTLGDDVEEVVLVTKILKANEAEQINSNGTEPAENPEQVNMTDKTVKDPAAAPQDPTANADTKKEPTVTVITNEQGKFEVTVNEKGETSVKLIEAAQPTTNAEAPKAKTFEDLLANASPEIREVMNASLKMHNDRKTALIKALKDNSRNKFSDEYLKAQSIDTLQNLAELANIPSYDGMAAPITPTANASDDEDAPPPAPLVFELNPKKDAA